MFGFRKTRNLQAQIQILQVELDRAIENKAMAYQETREWKNVAKQRAETIQEFQSEIEHFKSKYRDAADDAHTFSGMADQRMKTITAMKQTQLELETGAEELQARYATLEAENRQLRDGAGHALHALAAVQDLSTAFVKRLDMLPPYCGLPQDLVNSVFAGFDEDLQARKDLAREIEKQSFTIEMYADDNAVLQNGPDDSTTRFVDVEEIRYAIFGEDSRIDTDLDTHKFEIQDQKIHELGLYTIEIDLGKSVTANLKLWVVPSTNEPNSEEIHNS